MKIILKIHYLYLRYGLKILISKIISFVITKINLISEIDIARTIINIEIADLFQNKIKYGIFKEMKLSKNIWWGKFEVATKLLGQYELQVINKIMFG